MKCSIPVFLTAVMLTLLLAACGSETDNSIIPDSGVTNELPETAPVLPEEDGGIPTVPDADLPQTPADEDHALTGGIPMDEMLKNARVHDTDGDLLDGENAVTPGADTW